MQLFLEQMPKPVCIIAHNGVKFDFRVLYAELDRHSLLNPNPIPEQVYFVDSYLMFMDLEKKHHDDLRLVTQFIDWSKLTNKLCRPPKLRVLENSNSPREASDGEQKRSETEDAKTVDEANDAASSSCILLAIDESTRAVQFSTPPQRAREACISSSSPSSAKRRLFDIAYNHPLQFVRTSQWSPAKKKRVRSNFFQRLNDGDWVFDGHVSMQYFREKGVFKLEQMYKELINGPFEAHFAQDDCEALLQVCMAYGQEFIDYVDAKATSFPYHVIANSTIALT
uniref:Exonuclease domain-containing protein n=1 Tax=Parascaris univalens TaxID=6257 RepID=A0A915BF23_PARUN